MISRNITPYTATTLKTQKRSKSQHGGSLICYMASLVDEFTEVGNV